MRKKYPTQFEVKIESLAAEGKALAHIDGKVCFVPYAAPGDVVDLQITNKRKQYLEAKIVKFHIYSKLRLPPQCEHFGVCGGCKWQHLPYAIQLESKQQTVADHLKRIGHLQLPTILPIKASSNEFFYRNKLEYTFSNRRWFTPEELQEDTKVQSTNALGFHIPGLFDKVLDIKTCYLQAAPSNAIRLFFRDYALNKSLSFYDVKSHEGFLRNLIIRSTTHSDLMLIVVVNENNPDLLNPLMEAVKCHFPQITSLSYVVNTKFNDSIHDLDVQLFYGEPFITEEMKPFKAEEPKLRFRIGPQSFYQTNALQAENLYRIVADFADLQDDYVVYDLYTGAGTIAQYVARSVKKVIGVDYVESAIEDAKINAKLNNISNCDFFAGDMADVLTDEFINKHGRPNLIITDPPRAGMHEKVVQQILKTAPQKIVYVSCNSATQARDIALMKAYYTMEKIQAVDMFPQTHHVENVVLLRKITN